LLYKNSAFRRWGENGLIKGNSKIPGNSKISAIAMVATALSYNPNNSHIGMIFKGGDMFAGAQRKSRA